MVGRVTENTNPDLLETEILQVAYNVVCHNKNQKDIVAKAMQGLVFVPFLFRSMLFRIRYSGITASYLNTRPIYSCSYQTTP